VLRRSVSTVVTFTAILAACGGQTAALQTRASAPPPDADALAQLWMDPGKTPRDLFWGVGGEGHAPSAAAPFEVEDRDDSGFSVSYDLRGPDDRRWSAKIGPEAQTEVVVSRLLWGLGYHQPPVYYLPSFSIAGDQSGRRVSEARFRPKLESLEAGDAWPWADNPFLAATEFRGLLVVLLMVNGTDLKDDNNTVYDVKDGWDDTPRRWFVVRDLGAALGETGKLYPRRNWLEGYERSGFITGVSGDHVEFDYRGRHREVLRIIRPADVRWAAARMHRLTDAQLQDAFRAANYDPAIAARYITAIKARIKDGLAIGAGLDGRGAAL